MSDYVINGRPIWVRKRWPGSVTGVACYGCSRVRGARDQVFESRGNPLFVGVSFKWDRLETSWSVRVKFDHIFSGLTSYQEPSKLILCLTSRECHIVECTVIPIISIKHFSICFHLITLEMINDVLKQIPKVPLSQIFTNAQGLHNIYLSLSIIF